MRRFRSSSVALAGTLAVLLAPCGVRGQTPVATPAVTVSLSHVVGDEAVQLSGNAPAGAALEAALYARFSKDLPTVLLSRRPLAADAAGHYAAVMPIAPAFFRGAVVTAVVRTTAPGPSAQASVLVTEPNVPAPPDDLPASVR